MPDSNDLESALAAERQLIDLLGSEENELQGRLRDLIDSKYKENEELLNAVHERVETLIRVYNELVLEEPELKEE